MAVAVGAVVQAAAVVAVVSLLPQLASLLVVSRRANGVALAALALLRDRHIGDQSVSASCVVTTFA